jgi:endonuclease III-like uncharacterized protein
MVRAMLPAIVIQNTRRNEIKKAYNKIRTSQLCHGNGSDNHDHR